MRAALHIARKDLRQRLRDRSAYIVGLVAPLGLALLVGNLYGGVTEAEALRFAAVDDDGGIVAEAFLDALGTLEAQGHIAVTDTTRSSVDRLIEDEGHLAAFVVPSGFSNSVLKGEPAEIVVVGNPQEAGGTQTAEALASVFARDVAAVQLSVGTALMASGEPASTAAIQQLTEQAAASMTTPITLQPLDTEVSGFDAKTYFAAGMMVFFLFFVVQSGVLSLMAERESGTLTRLLAAPVSPASLILGKVLGSLVLGLASATVMVVATTLFIGAEWGDPLGVALLAVAGVLAAVGIVALIATFVTTEEQARSYSELAATFFGLLGGAFFPIGLATGIATQFSWASPHRWLLEGFRDLTAGDSAVDILPMVAVVLVFAVVTGAIGFLRSRKLVRLS